MSRQHASFLSHAALNSLVFSFIVDCLDMLLVMGLHEEYEQARQWVQAELTFEVDDKQHAFEVTIRVLGGLLAGESVNPRSFLLDG